MHTSSQEAQWSNLKSIDNNATYLFALVLVFTIPWANAIPIPGIGTISRALGLPLIALWLIQLARVSSLRSPVQFHYLAGTFVFWGACSLFWTVDTDTSLVQLQTYLQLFILCFILWTELYTEIRCLLFVQAYVLGAVLIAIFIFINYYEGNVTRWDRRASIAGIDENDIALTLSTAMVMAWFLFSSAIQYSGKLHPLFKFINLAYVPASVVAIIMTGSRGGFVSTFPAFIYIFVSFFSSHFTTRKKLLLVPLLTIAAYAVIKFSPAQPFKRISSTFEQLSSRNISGRWDIWQAGLTEWVSTDFSIFFGLGIGGNHASVGRAAHSTPISILVETGVIGLVIFTFIIASLVYAIFWRRGARAYRAFSITLLSVWVIGTLSLSWEYRKATWIIWSIIISFSYIATRIPPSQNRRAN